MALLQKIIFGFQVTLACTLAMDCRADNFDPSNLTDHCAELSRNSEYQYFPMNAKILESGITPPKQLHCSAEFPQSDCNKKKREGWLYAIIETAHFNVHTQGMSKMPFVVTPAENRANLLKKTLYLQEGRKYVFCARGPKNHGKDTFFYIDHISSIIEKK